MNLVVGQDLYYVPSQRRELPEEVTVLKVGRKWAELSNYKRINIETFLADGGQYSSPGRCYESKEAYALEQARAEAWQRLRRCFDMNHVAPSKVTVAQMNELLGLFEAKS